MLKNWPYLLLASFLNAVLITGAFMEFKLRGMAASQLPAALQPAWYQVDPFIFGGGIFIISLLLIMVLIAIKNLVITKSRQLHVTGYKLQGIHR
jgi:hypothetical protein